MATVSSPCIRACAIDPRSNLCRGCWRTLDEIAAWATFGEDERRAVMARLQRRRNVVRGAAPVPS